ncbi:hypothetical protein [Kitasatospora cinereorecta]|uniref:Uncharacterized protein n=1 Tax=Kitasatospora cinereorecta TaxID=285560 RepID=A0ABW0V8G4_9ACTN
MSDHGLIQVYDSDAYIPDNVRSYSTSTGSCSGARGGRISSARPCPPVACSRPAAPRTAPNSPVHLLVVGCLLIVTGWALTTAAPAGVTRTLGRT